MQREMMSVANLNSGGNRGLKQAMVVPVPPQNSIHAENTGFSRRAARQMNFPAPP